MRMSKKKKTKLVPSLRFPEFSNAEEWEDKSLGEVTYPVSERNKTGKKHEIYSISNIAGFIPQADQFDGVDSHSRGYDITLYKIIERNTFAYNPARINVGSIGYSNELHNILISSLYVCFKTYKELDDLFLLHYLKTSGFNEAVKRGVEGGIRSYLFYENFAKIRIQFPSILEQRRIAACLTSLDDLITAETERLEALRAHKKGMMQQLFPDDGNLVPKVRFAEFKNAEDWKENILGNLGDLVSGLTYSPEDVREEGLLVLRSSNVKDGEIVLDDCVYVKPDIKGANLSKPDDILICVRNGSKSLIGKSALIPRGLPVATHGAFMTVFRANNPKFAFQLFQSDSFNRKVAADLGATINSINNSQLVKYKFSVPGIKEQNKIADCLGSIDDIIIVQNKKVQLLKTQKKGMLQKMFPIVTG